MNWVEIILPILVALLGGGVMGSWFQKGKYKAEERGKLQETELAFNEHLQDKAEYFKKEYEAERALRLQLSEELVELRIINERLNKNVVELNKKVAALTLEINKLKIKS